MSQFNGTDGNDIAVAGSQLTGFTGTIPETTDNGDDIYKAGGGDVLTGGAARDIMNGGGGFDRFDFNAIAESGKTAATRDVISGSRICRTILTSRRSTPAPAKSAIRLSPLSAEPISPPKTRSARCRWVPIDSSRSTHQAPTARK